VNKFSSILLPFLKIKNKLLCSIIYTDDILNNIQNINNILSKIPNYNIVKLFLNIELEKPIINNATINNTKNIIKSIENLNIKKIIINKSKYKNDKKELIQKLELNQNQELHDKLKYTENKF